MSKRELVVWYVVYGIVMVVTGALAFHLGREGRMLDAAVVVLMASSALWMSMTNHDDPLEPPPNTGEYDSY